MLALRLGIDGIDASDNALIKATPSESVDTSKPIWFEATMVSPTFTSI